MGRLELALDRAKVGGTYICRRVVVFTSRGRDAHCARYEHSERLG
jgi:hypothetical protein